MLKISIIMPTYNQAGLIGKAIDSVMLQHFQNWELIIVNNFSTDNTVEVVNQYRDLRIKFYSLNNKGVIAKSRNFGITKSNGNFIAFLDSDDWWYPTKLEEVSKILVSSNVDVIYHNLKVINSLTTRKTRIRELRKPLVNDLLMNGNMIPNSSAVVRAQYFRNGLFISEDPKLVGCEDYSLWIELSLLGANFKYLNKILGVYLFNENGISKNKLFIKNIYLLKRYKYLLSNEEWMRAINYVRYLKWKEEKKLNWYLFYWLIKNSNIFNKLKVFLIALYKK